MVSQPDKVREMEAMLLKCYSIVQAEPETLQWFAVRYTTIENKYAIFDAFPSQDALDADLTGPVPSVLMANAKLMAANPDMLHLKVIASHAKMTAETKLKVGFRIFITAKE